jgi:hypothetical protein
VGGSAEQEDNEVRLQLLKSIRDSYETNVHRYGGYRIDIASLGGIVCTIGKRGDLLSRGGLYPNLN